MNTVGFVYFIQVRGTSMTKIGWSRNPRERMRQLSEGAQGLPLDLIVSIEGTPDLEAQLHEDFSGARVGNREWFAMSRKHLDEVLDFATLGSARIHNRRALAKLRPAEPAAMQVQDASNPWDGAS